MSINFPDMIKGSLKDVQKVGPAGFEPATKRILAQSSSAMILSCDYSPRLKLGASKDWNLCDIALAQMIFLSHIPQSTPYIPTPKSRSFTALFG